MPTPTASSPSTSSKTEHATDGALGQRNCPLCGGAGFLRLDVPPGHPQFGRLEPCTCRSAEIAENARQRLYALSNLERLRHLRFENFNPHGNQKAILVTPQEQESLQAAWQAAQEFVAQQDHWLLLEGAYGCGKTHLAAAIANRAVEMGVPTLFITVPDLLDSLRFAYSDPETTFEARFEEVRNAALLVLDDFGTQNATSWAQEKLFQIINYRYINKLPTVITTNLMLDEIEGRIRSRLQDEAFVKHIHITAPDYRRPNETSNPGISMLSSARIKEMTFGNFEFREDEIGKEIVTTVIKEKKYAAGRHKESEIIRDQVTAKHIESLRRAFHAAMQFAEKPEGWLVLLGPSYCGKTHLAAAIGNFHLASGGRAIMVDVSSLLDYLKTTFKPNSDVSFDRRFYEISTTPLLILDDIKESGTHSAWAEDKLYQLLNQRFNNLLPTVLTSTLPPDDFSLNYPSLWNRILDTTTSNVCVIDVPPYRPVVRRRTAAKKNVPTRDKSHVDG